MNEPVSFPLPAPSIEAVAHASDMGERHGDTALGKTRMQLYAALNEQMPARVDLLAQACHVLMEQERARNRTPH